MIDPTIVILHGMHEEDINPPYHNQFIVFDAPYSQLPFPIFDLGMDEFEDNLFNYFGGGWFRVISFDGNIRQIHKVYLE